MAVVSPDDYRKFVFWCICAIGYFYVLLTRLALRVPHPWVRRSVFALTLTACVSLGYAMFIPYLPDQIPDWAKLHVVLAAGSCVLLLAALLILLVYWRNGRLLKLWLGLNLCYGVLFLLGGMVSIALEVFFTLSAALLTRSLWLSIHSERSHTMEKKRFYRTEGPDAKLFGVCGGIAEYLDVDPSLVRILWVLATLCGSVGLWFYLACALILPKKSTIYPDL